jgi:hypothetical protein
MRQPRESHDLPGTQPHVTVRVRISLSKKAALYNIVPPDYQIVAAGPTPI